MRRLHGRHRLCYDLYGTDAVLSVTPYVDNGIEEAQVDQRCC